ncbi:DUF5825 family protein [Actinomadura welshii]
MIRTLPPGTETIVPGSVHLGLRPVQTARFIAWLRDRLSEGIVARWHGRVTPALLDPALHHLPPPRGADPETRDWRSRFRLGLCYYRQGPGFIQIKDVRDPAGSAAFVLDDPLLVRTFTRCLVPRSAADADAGETEAIDALVAERLLLRLDDLVVTLPSRMRRWPVPALDV